MAQLEVGSVFAGHRIDAIAGSGGMGVVYRATHLALDVTVAMKVIAAQFATDPGFRERFQRESRLAASIEHPNVVQVRHAGEEDGLLYITMRYVDGTDLRAMIEKQGRLEPKVAAEIVAQVASALDAAHARGLVHRDVKPANILIEERGSPKAYLTDFGLTRHEVSQGGLTRTGQWVGTLDYVAPEQIEGKQVDARSDVYALGCVLYHALSGEVPFPRDSEVATMFAHINDPPPELPNHLPGVTPELGEVIKRAMAKKPKDRYPSTGDLGRAALAAAEGDIASQAEQSVAKGKAASETKAAVGEMKAAVGETAADPNVTVASPTPAKAAAKVPGGKATLIGLGGVAVAGLVVAGLLITGVFGKGGLTAKDYEDAARSTLSTFQRDFGNRDLDGIRSVVTADAPYHYFAWKEHPAIKEYTDIFKAMTVINGYTLSLNSIRTSAKGNASVDANYHYTTENGYPHSGSLQMQLRPKPASKPLQMQITDVRASPDLVFSLNTHQPNTLISCETRLGSSSGELIAQGSKTFPTAGNSQYLLFQVSDTAQQSITNDSTPRTFCTSGANGSTTDVTGSTKQALDWAS